MCSKAHTWAAWWHAVRCTVALCQDYEGTWQAVCTSPVACGFGKNSCFRWHVPPDVIPSQVGRIRDAATKSLATQPLVAMHAPQHASWDTTEPLAMSAPLRAFPGRKEHSLDGVGLA